jgi:hypothetical protein
MNEHCDGCGKQFPVLETFFNGRQFLCLTCAAQKSATTMGIGLRQWSGGRCQSLQTAGR